MSTYKSASTFSKAPNFLLTILSSVVAIARGVEEGIAERWSLVAMPPNFFFFSHPSDFFIDKRSELEDRTQQPINIASHLLRLHLIESDEITTEYIFLKGLLKLQSICSKIGGYAAPLLAAGDKALLEQRIVLYF